uniref:cell division protein PerM n=1 Tax=Nocardia donostiensis TaxID=1538463 RepID=UPI00111BD2DE|nr:DUF6350 family protein [Nocardia donostiensis]
MSAPRNSPTRRTSGFRSPPEPSDEAGFLSLTPERARVLLLVATRPAAFALAAIVAVLLVTLATGGSGLSGLSGAVAASWLALHQVPLVIGTTTLGILPLLPTAVLLWAAARESAAAVEPEPTRADLGWLAGAALGGPLLITAVCLAVVEDASGTIALQPPNPLPAFGWVLVLHLAAAACGVGIRLRHQLLPWLPYWAVAAGYLAGHTLRRLLGCAAAITMLSFVANWSRIGDTYQHAGNFAGVLGLTLLSLLYLPNAVIAASSVLVGAGVRFGESSIDLFSVVGGEVPAVPVLAAVPSGPASGWWPLLLLIPAAVGVLGGIDAARVSDDRIRAPWALLASAGMVTAVALLAAVLAGGELGSFGRLSVDLPVLVVVTFSWLVVAGYAGLVFGRWYVAPFGTPIPGYEYVYDDYDEHAHDADDYDDADRYHDADDYYDDDLGHDTNDYYDAYDHPDDDHLGHREERKQARLPRYRGEYGRTGGPAEQEAIAELPAAVRSSGKQIAAVDQDPMITMDAELIDDDRTTRGSVRPAPGSRPEATAEIVDAEVVEADLPDSDPFGGR